MDKRTHLLDTGNVLGDVLNANGIFDSQAVRLALDTSFVDENTAVRSET
jgi:hypothetical protein